MKEWNLIDNDIVDKLPKEDCEIWITRTCFDGSRCVQKVNFYVNDTEIIRWDGTLAWMIASDDEKPEPYQGEYCYKFVAKTHRLAYGMKATYTFYLSFA